MGEATAYLDGIGLQLSISIHASRGGSDPIAISSTYAQLPISIHASRGGSDPYGIVPRVEKFIISIHASRGGSDAEYVRHSLLQRNFNPRFPWGKRLPQ